MSALETDDPRVCVLCSSNLFEPDIESLGERLDALNYTFFENNEGFRKNFRALLESSKADFSLLLSDEDTVISENLAGFLDFLSSLPSDTSAVGTRVVGLEEDCIATRKGNYRSVSTFSYESYVALAPLSTYMSGLIFSKRGLQIARQTFDSVFEESKGNVYPHLELVRETLPGGKLVICPDPVVKQGAPAGYGGDSHSHVDEEKTSSSSISSAGMLNPETYGPNARIRQFFFQESRISRLSGLHPAVRTVARLRLLTECRVRIQQSVSRSGELLSLRDQLTSAVRDAQNADEFSGSWAAKFLAAQVQRDFPGKSWLWQVTFFTRLMRGLATRIILFPNTVNSYKFSPS